MVNTAFAVDLLRQKFGDAVQENVTLAPYTSARIGGPADVMVTVKSADELADAMQLIWEHNLPYYILGGGSNVLVSDDGFRGGVVLDRAKEVRFEAGDQPTVWCEAGVIIANLAKRCASKDLQNRIPQPLIVRSHFHDEGKLNLNHHREYQTQHLNKNVP